jgi:hypothetical protein
MRGVDSMVATNIVTSDICEMWIGWDPYIWGVPTVLDALQQHSRRAGKACASGNNKKEHKFICCTNLKYSQTTACCKEIERKSCFPCKSPPRIVV